MQNLIKTSYLIGSTVVSSIAYAGVMAVLFLFVGVSVAHADTNYVVDSSGSCGTICQNLQSYLNGDTTAEYNYADYTSTDVPFIDAYTGGSGSSNSGYGSTSGYDSDPYSTNAGTDVNGDGYVDYPYLIYNYYPTAAPTYSATTASQAAQVMPMYVSYGSGSNYAPYSNQYPNQIYTTYGQKAPSYSYNSYGTNGSTGSGFIMTSGY